MLQQRRREEIGKIALEGKTHLKTHTHADTHPHTQTHTYASNNTHGHARAHTHTHIAASIKLDNILNQIKRYFFTDDTV